MQSRCVAWSAAGPPAAIARREEHRVRLLDHTRLPPSEIAQLSTELHGLGLLADVVRWTLTSRLPAAIRDVVIQDEFTHDVIVSRGDRYLVFDTT